MPSGIELGLVLAWQYRRSTYDDAFFLDAGAEILLETARFWASRAVCWRGRRVQIRIAGATVRVAMSDGAPVDLRIAGGIHRLQAGTTLEMSLESGTAIS